VTIGANWNRDMQRSSGIVPSALKPPRPPGKNKTAQMVTVVRNDSCNRDDKGDKAWWMCNAEQAVHLVPIVLLTCLLILYICSSARFHEFENLLCDEMSQNVVETTMITERHLQQAVGSKLQGEERNLSTDVLEKLGTDLQDHPSDLPVNTMLRVAAS
jgi:hypothetical protein